jgi:hypothetical protein
VVDLLLFAARGHVAFRRRPIFWKAKIVCKANSTTGSGGPGRMRAHGTRAIDTEILPPEARSYAVGDIGGVGTAPRSMNRECITGLRSGSIAAGGTNSGNPSASRSRTPQTGGPTSGGSTSL